MGTDFDKNFANVEWFVDIKKGPIVINQWDQKLVKWFFFQSRFFDVFFVLEFNLISKAAFYIIKNNIKLPPLG